MFAALQTALSLNAGIKDPKLGPGNGPSWRQKVRGLSTANTAMRYGSPPFELSPASMKNFTLPILLLPVIAVTIAVCLAVLFASIFDQAQLRGIYLVWQENETFAAASVA